MPTKQFYYGDGTENIVELTQAQADSTNNLRIEEVIETPEGTYANVGFVGPGDIESYNEAAEILNKFLETHTVTWSDTDVPAIRPVQ